MIASIFLVLWALFIIAVLIVTFSVATSIYPFQHYDDVEIPYITLDIQGNKMNMIVDTGCAVSLLSKPAISNCELLYRDAGKSVALSAITEDKVEASAVTIDFKLGKRIVSEDFFIHDVPDFGNFNRMHGIKIHGLLGTSFLNKNNAKADFKNHTLIIP